MIQLHQDYGGIPVVFIRYNPDSYKKFDDNGKPFGKAIRTNKKRLQTLLDLIKGLGNRQEWNIPSSVYYLFYDGYDAVPRLYEINYL